MTSVFRRLIKKEFGSRKYEQYYSSIRSELEKTDVNNSEKKISAAVYGDMTETLKGKETSIIAQMHDRLNNTFIVAVQINRSFVITLLVYLIAVVSILVAEVTGYIAVIAIVLLSLCFGYKTYEFISNKFCYIDMQIVLEYKKVLEKLLVNSVRITNTTDGGNS